MTDVLSEAATAYIPRAHGLTLEFFLESVLLIFFLCVMFFCSSPGVLCAQFCQCVCIVQSMIAPLVFSNVYSKS